MGRFKLETLSDFSRHGYEVRIVCLECRHSSDRNPIILQQQVHQRGLSQRIDRLERALKCTRCGKKRTRISAIESQF